MGVRESETAGAEGDACSGDKPLRILILTPIEPYPPTSGWLVVLYNDIKYLAARGHKLYVLSLTYDKSASPREISEFGEVEYFLAHKPPRWVQVLSNIGKPLPFTIVRHDNEALLARASELIRNGEIDVVMVEDVVMGRYARMLKDVAPIPVFLRGHNINATRTLRFCQIQKNPIIRYLAWREVVKSRRFESAVHADFDCVAQISPIDAEQADEMTPGLKCRTVYSGVDLDYFTPVDPSERDANVLMHVGGLSPIVGLSGMMWFADNVLPKVRERFPQARLELVGNVRPRCRLHEADPSEIVTHGIVPDVRPYLTKGAVFVVPLFVGSGIRIKIINALAAGNAIVATSVAAEGLPVTDGHDIFIADDERRFTECVCRLLEDPELRGSMGRQARKLVEERLGWPRIAEDLEACLREAIARQRAGVR